MKFFKLALILIVTGVGVRAQITGRVVNVADGDTFTMLTDGNNRIKVAKTMERLPQALQRHLRLISLLRSISRIPTDINV